MIKLPIYYFLGAGGIGMSALARFFNQNGYDVFGYDKTPSPLTDDLIEEGIKLNFEDRIEAIPTEVRDNKNKVIVVYTPAIPKDSNQYLWFIQNAFTLKKRSVVLGEISSNTFNIAVAGTHGKTTTSCMVAHLLRTANIPFTAFLGGISTDLGSNYFNSGKLADGTQVTVTEADEFDRSFLTLSPSISIITSNDADHLDIYGREDEVKKSFHDFALRLKPGGTLLYTNRLTGEFTEIAGRKSYGIGKGTIHAEQVRFENGRFLFDLYFEDDVFRNVELGVPGWHNVENAVAAAAVAKAMGASEADIKLGLKSFRGVKRRFEYIIRLPNCVFIDDYAHHPTELEAIISSVKRMYPDKKVTGVFQPHLYTRTRDFATGFAQSLDLLHRAVLLPVYPARELPIPGVESEMIYQLMKSENKSLSNKENLIETLNEQPVEVLLTLGAGDIDREVPKLKKWLDEKV